MTPSIIGPGSFVPYPVGDKWAFGVILKARGRNFIIKPISPGMGSKKVKVPISKVLWGPAQ